VNDVVGELPATDVGVQYVVELSDDAYLIPGWRRYWVTEFDDAGDVTGLVLVYRVPGDTADSVAGLYNFKSVEVNDSYSANSYMRWTPDRPVMWHNAGTLHVWELDLPYADWRH